MDYKNSPNADNRDVLFATKFSFCMKKSLSKETQINDKISQQVFYFPLAINFNLFGKLLFTIPSIKEVQIYSIVPQMYIDFPWVVPDVFRLDVLYIEIKIFSDDKYFFEIEVIGIFFISLLLSFLKKVIKTYMNNVTI